MKLLLTILLALTCVLAGCTSGQAPVGFGDTLYFIEGNYESVDEVGSLGRVLLELERVEETQSVYRATLTSIDNADLGESKGIGTLGGTSLILNFDRGLESDYYFQGFLLLSGQNIDALDGNFVIPDLEDQVSVRFEPR